MPDYETGARPKRTYKATLFAMLFSERENLLELYNAVNGTSYSDPELLEINTLENAIYVSMMNDVSFVIDSRLELYEHQSTFSPNLPLRFLFYVSDLFASMTAEENLFGSKLIELPTPNFLIFYNGTMEQPDRMELRLSDAFKVAVDEPALELTATMYNISIGHNQKLLKACRTLREYAEYTDRVRKYARQMKIGQAVEQAVTECISEGILADFLRRNRAEAMNLSIYEIDEERMKELFRQDGYECGWDESRVASKVEDILKLLEIKGELPESLSSFISGMTDLDQIDEYFQLAARVNSVEEFLERIKDLQPSGILKQGVRPKYSKKNRAKAKNLSMHEIDEERMKELFRQDGYECGWDAGEIAGRKKDILKLLELKGDLSDDLAEQIRGESDPEKVDKYFALAARTVSVEEFLAAYQKEK